MPITFGETSPKESKEKIKEIVGRVRANLNPDPWYMDLGTQLLAFTFTLKWLDFSIPKDKVFFLDNHSLGQVIRSDNSTKIERYLKNNPSSVSKIFRYDMTLPIFAILHKKKNALRSLVEAGAPIDQALSYGSVISLALVNKDRSYWNILAQSGRPLDISASNLDPIRPTVFEAIKTHRVKTSDFKIVLGSLTNLNISNSIKQTPAVVAAIDRNLDKLEILISNGSSATIPAYNGLTAKGLLEKDLKNNPTEERKAQILRILKKINTQ